MALALLLVLSLVSSPGYAQEEIAIQGQVRNGTADAEVPQGVTVTLQVFSSGQNLETRETVADDQGRFLFEAVQGGVGYGYIISTSYLGVVYSYEKDYPLPQEPVALVVYETTTSSQAIRGTGYTMVVDSADPRSQVMSAYELVSLENTGDRTFVASFTEGGAMDFLRFSLPPAATNLSVRSDMQGGQIIRVATGFALTTTVTPGPHEVDFSYTTPFEGGKLSFAHSFPFGADAFRVLFLQELGQIQSAGMNEVDPLLFGTDLFQHLEALDLAPGAKVTLDFSGLPQSSAWQRWQDALPGGDLTKFALPGTFGLALLALLAYVLVGGGVTSRAAPAEAPGNEGQRLAIMEAMARLDDRFQRRELGMDEYLQQRREMRDRLLSWAALSGSRGSRRSSGSAGSTNKEG